MSVAFRRESDEEHKEPRFELPLPAGPNYVTARGLRLIQAKVAELADATSDEAKREARYWGTRLATAQLAPPPPAGAVAIGARVTIRLNGAEKMVDIVGHDEGDPASGSTGTASPRDSRCLPSRPSRPRTSDMPDFARHRQPWKQDEVQKLHTLAKKGMGLKAIAKALTRTEESVKDRAKEDGLNIAKLR